MFWCHNCNRRITPTDEFTCPHCHGEFIEDLNDPDCDFVPPPEPDNMLQQFLNSVMQRILRPLSAVITGAPISGDFFTGSDEQFQQFLERLFNMDHGAGSPPAEKEFVENLKEVPYTPDVCKDGTCSICLDQFEENEGIYALPCGHGFHPDCIKPWLAMHSECPECRAPLPQSK